MYEKLSSELENRILMAQNRTLNEPPRRVDNPHDRGSAWRPAYVRDADKILHCPFYNRYADKTQVFSFYKNDDISRRGAHVQFVSRNARTIGRALGLDLDLIEAIALGHDIGHTPFGHAGEKYLDELFYAHAGRHFAHNIHSVRVLDTIFPLNLTLDTLSGIASHDGELELIEYRPDTTQTFETFDLAIENCYLDKANILKLVPNTLEGCVVRISDIISYLGKDRQDAEKLARHNEYEDTAIGTFNAAIINNLIVNIIENSYGKDFIAMDDVYGYVPSACVEKFHAEVKKGLPIVLCMHVPFYTDDIWRANQKFWTSAAQHGKPNFFRSASVPDACGDYAAQQQDPVTREFIAYLKSEKLLKGILAGHLHITVQERFSPTAMQYVVGGNFLFHGQEVLFT